jgi:two-component system, OmpR family, sensor histidine kinase VicK
VRLALLCQTFFETQWKKAIPAKQRIREIEEGAKNEVVEIIRDPVDIQRIRYDFIKSAKKEILIIFSTANAFHLQIKEDYVLLELLKETTESSRRVKIRILVPAEQTINEMAGQLKGFGIVVRDYKSLHKLLY